MKRHITLFLCIAALYACGNRRYEVGSVTYVPHLNNRVVVDCDMTLGESLATLPEYCPSGVTDNLALVEVFYYSFDHTIHRGQVLMDYRLADDIQKIFAAMIDARFPLYGVIPIDHSAYSWDDYETVPEGNTYSFHYRKIAFKNKLSYHSYGQAIDINPILNPFRKWGVTFPPGGTYNPEEPGTLYNDHPVVKAFRRYGWKWGGDWKRKDYQHFQKPLKGEADIHTSQNPGTIRWPRSLRRNLSGNSFVLRDN